MTTLYVDLALDAECPHCKEDVDVMEYDGDTGEVNLDDIARGLHKLLSESNVSFVKPAASDSLNQLRFDIVKRVIEVRQEEATAKAGEREKAAKRQKILELIEKRQDETLESLSLDDLKAQLEALK